MFRQGPLTRGLAATPSGVGFPEPLENPQFFRTAGTDSFSACSLPPLYFSLSGRRPFAQDWSTRGAASSPGRETAPTLCQCGGGGGCPARPPGGGRGCFSRMGVRGGGRTFLARRPRPTPLLSVCSVPLHRGVRRCVSARRAVLVRLHPPLHTVLVWDHPAPLVVHAVIVWTRCDRR